MLWLECIYEESYVSLVDIRFGSRMRHPSKDVRRPGSNSRVILLVVVLFGVMVVLGLWSHPGTSVGAANQRFDSPSLRIDDGTDDPAVLMKPDPPERFDGPQEGMTGHQKDVLRLQHLPEHSHYLTIVLMSYPKSSRFHLLEQIIRKCAKWEFVWEIILVWNGDRELLPQRIQVLRNEMLPKAAVAQDGEHLHAKRVTQGTPFFTILPQLQNRVDNRWRIARFIDTAAVLNMDDDINLYTEGAKCMLDVWRASPSSLVAIDVRSHFVHAKSGGGPFGVFGYVARDRSAGFKQYSIALPRALLTHREYYVAYDTAWNTSNGGTAEMEGGGGVAPHGVKQIVDELLCDDIAFNFVAASTPLLSNEQLPGGHVIYAKARYAAYPESHSADGMTKKEGMKAMRQKCVNALAKHFTNASAALGGRQASRAQGMLLTHRPWHVLCEVDG